MTSPCPSPAELAALLAGRLADARAAEVRAHLADCEDCYEQLTEVAVFEEEEGAGAAGAGSGAGAAAATGRVVVDPPPGPMAATRAGKLLAHRAQRSPAPWLRRAAIAAALAVAAASAAWWWQARRDGADALYAAATDPRPGIVRLSGAPYQEPEPVLRGGAEGEAPRWKLLAAAERVRERAAADPSARNLHALGIAQLLLGETDAAIEQLERARAADRGDPRVASDLGAALIHRGLAGDRAEDLAAGLEVLLGKGEAVTLSDRFNRALALDRPERRAEAIAEWERYLELDRDSEWAAEARERLERARQDAAAERP